MANPFQDFFRRQFVDPAVQEQTAPLRKELNRMRAAKEEKDFAFVTEIAQRFGASALPNEISTPEALVSWTYININTIAERVADIQFELYGLTKGGVQEIETNPALDLLYRVNDYQTKWDLIYLWTFNMLARGEAAWYLLGRDTPNGKPREIWSLRTEYLKIVPGNLKNNEFIAKYEYRVPGQPLVTFSPWEVLFFKIPHPTNAYRGYGLLEAAAADVRTDAFSDRYNQRFFENFARPDSVLMTDQKLSDDTYRRLMAAWEAKYRGPDNAGKTAILEQGLKHQVTEPSAKDMDFINQKTWSRDKLMATFRNTKVILGIVEDVNRANAEASEMVWLKHTIRPKMRRIVDYLNEFYVPIFGDGMFLGFEDPVQQAPELKLQEYDQGVDRWLTRNEIREREGLEPVEGGDSLYVAFTNTAIGGQPQPEPLPGDSADSGKILKELTVKKGAKRQEAILAKRHREEVIKLKNRQERHQRQAESVNKLVRHMIASYQDGQRAVVLNRTKDLATTGIIAKDIQEKRWEAFIRTTDVYEGVIGGVVSRVLGQYEEETLGLIRTNYTPKKGYRAKKTTDDLLPDDRKYVKLSAEALQQVTQSLAKEQGLDVYAFLGLQEPYLPSKHLLERLAKFALEGSESYLDTTRARIATALIEGVRAGDGIEPLQRRVRAAFQEITPDRARVVARTETIRAANATTNDSFKQSGVVTGKQWFTAMDERVDDECAALDGKIVELDDDFDKLADVPRVYSNIGYPPIHPNCRCTISPVVLTS